MKKNKFQPIVRDDDGNIRRRYETVAGKLGIQRRTLAQHIFEEGLSKIEKQLAAEKERIKQEGN